MNNTVIVQSNLRGTQGALGGAGTVLDTLSARDAAVSAKNAAVAAAGSASVYAGVAGDAANSAAAAAQAANIASQNIISIGFATVAAMNADLSRAENTLCIVTNDPAPANNGHYIKVGAAGSGSWQKSAYAPPVAAGSVSLASLANDAKYGMLRYMPVIIGDGVVVCNGNLFKIENGINGGEVGLLIDKYLVSIAPCSLGVNNTDLVVLRGLNITANMLRPSNQLTAIVVNMTNLQMNDIVIAWSNNEVYSIWDDQITVKKIKAIGFSGQTLMPIITQDATITTAGNYFKISNGTAGQVGFMVRNYLVTVAPCIFGMGNTMVVVLRNFDIAGLINHRIIGYPGGQATATLTVIDDMLPTDIILAWCDTQGVHTIWDVNNIINNNANMLNGVDVSNYLAATTQRLLLPPKMYFIDGDDLPVYKYNIIAESDYSILNNLKTVLITGIDGSDKYQGFDYTAVLRPEKLASVFQIGLK